MLLVDDDPDFITDFRILMPPDIDCQSATSVEEAHMRLQQGDFDVVFLDIDLGPGGNGLEFLTQAKQEYPYLPVIMITADQQIPTVVKAIRQGASDYVGKCPDLQKLKLAIDRAIEENRLRRRCELLESELRHRIGELIGESEAMRAIRQEMHRLAAVSCSVLITGRSGTGKELVARGIHHLSPRRDQPFIAVNCPALAAELIESELFGHEKGAFTGAAARRIGKFEQVGEGTLFLDEVTEIPPHVQAKLLRVLQEKEFERLGGGRLIPFLGRILASTNRDIDQAVASGKLREDLLYRLNVTHIHLPTLAERQEDISLLTRHFVNMKAAEMKKAVPDVSDEALRLLYSYSWPGNVRELSNCIERAIVRCDGPILGPEDFGVLLTVAAGAEPYESAKNRCLRQFQRVYINTILRKHEGHFSRAADEMGISRQGLAKMMKACGLTGSGDAEAENMDEESA